MTNIIDLSTKSAPGETLSASEDDSRTYQELKMRNLVCIQLREISILGLTDKDVDFDIIAFVTVSLKNPFVVTVSAGEISMTPYFAFAPSVVATFNTIHIEAYIAQDRLPPELIQEYAKRQEEGMCRETMS